MSTPNEEIARKARISIYQVENEDKDAEDKIERVILAAIEEAFAEDEKLYGDLRDGRAGNLKVSPRRYDQ